MTEIEDKVFKYCKGLKYVVIPDSVTLIGENAFEDCTGLTIVVIPESVSSIGRQLFYGCTRLTSVTIPESVTSIGDSAFGGCTGLTALAIPNSVFEVQAVHSKMLAAQKGLDAHKAYNQFRSFAEIFGMLDLGAQLATVDGRVGGGDHLVLVEEDVPIEVLVLGDVLEDVVVDVDGDGGAATEREEAAHFPAEIAQLQSDLVASQNSLAAERAAHKATQHNNQHDILRLKMMVVVAAMVVVIMLPKRIESH